ncbi:MAG: hypothetical protein AAB730_01045 [Patescibacteria group bacterium]
MNPKRRSDLHRYLILDLKWKKFLRIARWFRFAPFLKFVLANGSMVLNVANENSDFDVLVAVENGRIFTVRYILNFIFSVLKARRLDDIKGSSPDKLCFNHFITAPTYKRRGLNEYGAELYRNLVPLYGNEKDIREFFEANREYGINPHTLSRGVREGVGINPELNLLDLRFRESQPNIFAMILEWILGGRRGDFVEKKIAEPIARRRLAKYLGQKIKKEKVIVSEDELEFHFELQ